MKKSFGENNNYVEMKELKAKRDQKNDELLKSAIKCDFIAIEEEPPITAFKEKVDLLFEEAGLFYSVTNVNLEIPNQQVVEAASIRQSNRRRLQLPLRNPPRRDSNREEVQIHHIRLSRHYRKRRQEIP